MRHHIRMLNNVQILRAIAAYLVVLNHAFTNFYKYSYSDSYSYSDIIDTRIFGAGVDIFFVISGFIMVYISARCPQSTGMFWKNRIIRIVPLYWLATFVTLASAILGSALLGVQSSGLRDWDFGDLVASLLMVPDIRADGATWPILPVGWTLVYEAFFYFLFGLTLLLCDLRRAVLLLTGTMLSLVVIGAFLTDVPFAIFTYTRPIILEFCIGAIFGILYTQADTFKLSRPVMTASALLAVAVPAMIIGDQVHPVSELTDASRFFILGLPSAMIVASTLILEQSGIVSRNRFLLLQGNASYSIYLFHLLVLAIFYIVVAKLVPLHSLPVALAVMISSIIACGIGGTLIHLLIEKPLHDFFRARRVNAPMPAQMA